IIYRAKAFLGAVYVILMDMDSKRKKIALVLPTLKSGGMERVMSILANYFAGKSDIEVHLVLYGKKHVLFYRLSEKVIVHKPERLFNDKYRQLEAFRRMVSLRKKIRKINP